MGYVILPGRVCHYGQHGVPQSCSFSESPGGCEPPKPWFGREKSSGPDLPRQKKVKIISQIQPHPVQLKDQIPLFWEELCRTQMKMDVMRVKAHCKFKIYIRANIQ